MKKNQSVKKKRERIRSFKAKKKVFKSLKMEQKLVDTTADTGELELTEDYVVLDDVASMSNLDLSNLRKRKIKIITSAKETIESGMKIS